MFEQKAEELAWKLVEKDCVAIDEDRARRDIIYSFKKGIELGYNKANEWHDLIKNPNDLPTESKRYLCMISCSVGGATVYECSDYDIRYNSWKDSYGDVIKWKDIVDD